MKSVVVEVPPQGTCIELHLKAGGSTQQAVLVLPDNVELGPPNRRVAGLPEKPAPAREWRSHNGFPPRDLTRECIVQILSEHGGEVKIRDVDSGWNIYDEVAARLGVSIEARWRLTEGTGEPAWRPEVGFARKDLERSGIIAPTDSSGRGVWRLTRAKP